MSALTLSVFLLAIAGAVLALGAVQHQPRPIPVRIPAQAARRWPAR